MHPQLRQQTLSRIPVRLSADLLVGTKDADDPIETATSFQRTVHLLLLLLLPKASTPTKKLMRRQSGATKAVEGLVNNQVTRKQLSLLLFPLALQYKPPPQFPTGRCQTKNISAMQIRLLQ